MKRTYPLLLTWNKGLKTRRDAEAQLVDVRRLVLTVDLNSDAGLQGRFISTVKHKGGRHNQGISDARFLSQLGRGATLTRTLNPSRMENEPRRIIDIWRLRHQHKSAAVHFSSGISHYKSNTSRRCAIRKCIICRPWPGELAAGCIYSYINPSRGTACCSMRWDYSVQTVWKLTCLSPDGQILILLDIQHDLQPVSHSALLGFPGRGLVAIKCVAFAVSSVNLEEKRFLSWTSPQTWRCTRQLWQAAGALKWRQRYSK